LLSSFGAGYWGIKEISKLSSSQSIVSYNCAKDVLSNLESKRNNLLEESVYIPTELYSNQKVDELNKDYADFKNLDAKIHKIDSAIVETKKDLETMTNSSDYKKLSNKIDKRGDIVNYSLYGLGGSFLTLLGIFYFSGQKSGVKNA
jgi:hypothetical protein